MDSQCIDIIGSIATQVICLALKNGYGAKGAMISLRKRMEIPRYGRRINANPKRFWADLKSRPYSGKLIG
jgi:hypothetical protein